MLQILFSKILISLLFTHPAHAYFCPIHTSKYILDFARIHCSINLCLKCEFLDRKLKIPVWVCVFQLQMNLRINFKFLSKFMCSLCHGVNYRSEQYTLVVVRHKFRHELQIHVLIKLLHTNLGHNKIKISIMLSTWILHTNLLSICVCNSS